MQKIRDITYASENTSPRSIKGTIDGSEASLDDHYNYNDDSIFGGQKQLNG